MNNYGGPERRIFTRKRAHCILNYKITQPPEVIMNVGRKEFEAVMLDLSEGGLALVARHDIPVGALVRMRWTLINPLSTTDNRIREFDLSGEVRNTSETQEDEYRLGINFIDLGEGDRKAIIDFIKSNRKP